jgi:hypothetical protein
MKKLALITLLFACFAVPAAPAFAQDGDAYGNVAGSLETGSGSGGNGNGGVVSGDGDNGSLPFTGFALVGMLGVGVLLLGTGLVLRRARPE